jgi:(S)-ureidoglycine aminohydrolase
MKTAMHNLGHTRSSHQRDHLLHTPDAFVRSPLPGMTLGTAIVHAAPAIGAAFTQYTAELETEGTLGSTTAQRFVYVLEGSIDLATGTSFQTLDAGGYAYLPAATEHTVTARESSRLAVIEKPYQPLNGVAASQVFVGKESTVPAVALAGDIDLEVRTLLPHGPAIDFAVNTMTYQPGAALSMVEVHVMEHGLLMLEGGGIYRLGDAWYPVTAGDFIWMGPYCPQWFGALGKKPAKYLIYKDWNRHPLG